MKRQAAFTTLAVGAMLLPVAPASAALDLSRYNVASVVALLGKEQSAVAYDYDQDRLLIFNDEGTGSEYTTGGTATSDPLYLSPENFYDNDTEALTYIGDNKFVIGDERTATIAIVEAEATQIIIRDRPFDRYRFNIRAAEDVYSLTGGVNIGNEGLEGITYDPITGGFIAAMQTGEVYLVDPNGGPLSGATRTLLFDAAAHGLSSLNDIQALSFAPDFAGRDFGENLLLLSATDKMLLEITRQGSIVSSFNLDIFPPRVTVNDLSPTQIEGVTIDLAGNIYLVSELGGTNKGTLVKLQAAAVPEPATWVTMIAGFGLVGGAMRARSRRIAVRTA